MAKDIEPRRAYAVFRVEKDGTLHPSLHDADYGPLPEGTWILASRYRFGNSYKRLYTGAYFRVWASFKMKKDAVNYVDALTRIDGGHYVAARIWVKGCRVSPKTAITLLHRGMKIDKVFGSRKRRKREGSRNTQKG